MESPHLLNTLIIIMKLILAIAVACLAPAIKADFTCDDCITFGTAMQGYLLTADSIAEQTELLVAILCPRLKIQLNVTVPSENTGQELLLLCTLSSWGPTLSVLSLVSVRGHSSPPQPVTNAPDQSVQLPMSLSPRHRLLRSLLSLREMDIVEVWVTLIVSPSLML